MHTSAINPGTRSRTFAVARLARRAAAGTVAGTLAALAVLVATGCAGDLASSDHFAFGGRGERWSVLCLELRGPLQANNCEDIARVLRATNGIDARNVQVVHEQNMSAIYYGRYLRRRDPHTGRREIPRRMVEDLNLIKELSDPQGRRYFLGAHFVPAPLKDAGNPEWALRRAPGKYSLQVAVFFNTNEFHQRKRAAAQYVQQLRDQGYEAYYYHGPSSSSVTVGSFGPEAVAQRNGLTFYSPEVQALQQKETFRYNLTNGRRWHNVGHNRRTPVASQLIAIPHDEASW